MDKLRIDLVSSEDGDWEALYINGVMSYENHSIDARHVLCAIKDFIADPNIFDVHNFEVSEDDMEDMGWSLPSTTAKIKNFK